MSLRERVLAAFSRIRMFDLGWYREMGEITEETRQARSVRNADHPPPASRDFARTIAPPVWKRRGGKR